MHTIIFCYLALAYLLLCQGLVVLSHFAEAVKNVKNGREFSHNREIS